MKLFKKGLICDILISVNWKEAMFMKFLIVEDERHLNDILFDYISDAFLHSQIDQVFSGDKAIDKIQENEYDLVLLDVMLPKVSGFEICKEIKSTSNTPVIMLSALSDEENQIKGYDLGIDEFVKKPYSPKIVIKKMKAVLSRYKKLLSDEDVEYGLLTYNMSTHRIHIEDEEIVLNKKEWDLFEIFIQNIGHIIERETLLNKVWGYDYFGDERTLDTHIKRLRQKLKSASPYIKTIYKTGYMFEK